MNNLHIGLRCLELTNQFRKSNGLQPVVWSQELCDIGMPHSKDMAEGRVPFSHQGFDRRNAQVKFAKMSMAENVAYNQGYADPPKVIENLGNIVLMRIIRLLWKVGLLHQDIERICCQLQMFVLSLVIGNE